VTLLPQGAQEADDLREYTEREESAPAEGFRSSLADKLRGALKPRDK
jgi:hypothetical protein